MTSKRQTVLDCVRIAHARNGPTAVTIGYFVDNRIGRAAYEEARRVGIAQWRDCQANPDQVRCKTYAQPVNERQPS